MEHQKEYPFDFSAIYEIEWRAKLMGEEFSQGDGTIDTNIDIGLGIVHEHNTIFVNVSVSYKDSKDSEELMFYHTQLHFDISPDIIPEADNITSVDKNLVRSLIQLSISMVRGIIYARTKGTYLQSQLLPLVNSAAITEDVIQKAQAH